MKKQLKPAITQQNWLDNSESAKIKVEVVPYSLKELSQLYKLSSKVFKKSLQPFTPMLGERKGHFYTVKQVEIIFMQLGIPYSINEV